MLLVKGVTGQRQSLGVEYRLKCREYEKTSITYEVALTSVLIRTEDL